jgi:uncharacterized membrane protein
VNERSFERSAAAYSPTGYGPESRLSGIPVAAGGAGCADVDTQRSIGASIDGDAPLRTPAWPLSAVAKHHTGRRARSRKRRPSQHSARELSERATAPVRATPRSVGAVAQPKTLGERPQAPWHPLPLSELLILVGMIGAVVAFVRGVPGNVPLLAASIGAVAIGTLDVALREHLAGFRAHTLMLAVIPAVIFHTAVVLVVPAFANQAPRWLNVALLPLDVAIVVVCFKLLRARYVDARRERTFAGLR